MTDSPAEELDDIESDLADASDEGREIVDQIRESDEGALRAAVRYGGDDHEVVYIREDIEAQFSEAELDERVETLVMKGLGDPTEEGALFDFGGLDATVRWYDAVVVAHFPVREWSGLVFTFDRESDSLGDIVDEYF
ncbi:hypothetical protein I7X12_14580 [Halosimplex litoreum]|uniref:Uncharacterized protein n=1 Tax=Halosimplex litoreum TaxID=1198301 RepID=A0A7T3FWH0_9EURY|nr:hypothetical protein [Halosimplex litoreum]QPV61970.1 hypothetical protein I7X12_14580 [Halosimplex litoreum]